MFAKKCLYHYDNGDYIATLVQFHQNLPLKRVIFIGHKVYIKKLTNNNIVFTSKDKIVCSKKKKTRQKSILWPNKMPVTLQVWDFIILGKQEEGVILQEVHDVGYTRATSYRPLTCVLLILTGGGNGQ